MNSYDPHESEKFLYWQWLNCLLSTESIIDSVVLGMQEAAAEGFTEPEEWEGSVHWDLAAAARGEVAGYRTPLEKALDDLMLLYK